MIGKILMIHIVCCYLGGIYYTTRYKRALDYYYKTIPFLTKQYYKIGKLILMFLFLFSFISVPVFLFIDIKNKLRGLK